MQTHQSSTQDSTMLSKNFGGTMFVRALQLTLTGIMLASCAQEKPFDELESKKHLLKSGQLYAKGDINFCTIDDPCLYVPSVADTPMNVTASRPYWQGDAKLVVTRLTEDELQILQIEEDDRFVDNINNFSPVASFSIDHIDYKCKKDSLNKCTNVEEEDKDKYWEQRRFVKINEVSVTEKNSLPIQFGELFRAGCFAAGSGSSINVGDKLVDVESKKAINFGMKVPYQAGANCVPLREMDDLRYLNFTVDYQYSLVKLSEYTDKSFEPLRYNAEDERYYGYFKTEKKKLSVDNRDDVMGLREHVANRWSPNRSEVVYYLNADFYKPEMKAIKKATVKSIKAVNKSLKRAGAKFEIVLKDGRNKVIGDLRNNFLILVSDPQASGVIGYGPSVANPFTGEIINARTVMYFGTIQKFISRAYDERVEALQDAEAAPAPATNNTSDNAATSNVDAGTVASIVATNLQNQVPGSVNNYVVNDRALNIRNNNFMSFLNRRDLDNVSQLTRLQFEDLLRRDEDVLDNIGSMEDKLAFHNENLKRLSEQTFYHADNFNFEGAIGETKCIDDSNPQQLQKWDNLDPVQRKEMLDCLIPSIWVPTLVHEFGHNLGLRHNFYGSTDKENFYNSNERSARNVPANKKVTYSSIMDYAYSTINELSIMGKYDEAALGYAYGGQVQTKDGGIVKLPNNIATYPEDKVREYLRSEGIQVSNSDNIERVLIAQAPSVRAKAIQIREKAANVKQEFKRYKYCSDEHVSNDLLCNRFDEGTDYKEVAEHYIRTYKKNYERRNFRGRRRDMSGRYGDLNYTIGLFNTLGNIRVFFDRFDQAVFQRRFDEELLSKPEDELTEEEKKEKADLISLKAASDLSFNALMDIVETPAYHCLEVEYVPQTDDQGNERNVPMIRRVLPFNEMAKGTQLEEYGITFDIRYGCEILTNIVGNSRGEDENQKAYFSIGKYFNNSLDLTIPDRSQIVQGDTSQIDVRGYWQDKVIASLFLSSRFQSPTTIGAASDNNYLDYPEYKERFIKFITGLLTNKFTKEVEIKNGESVLTKMPITYSFEGNHLVNKSYNRIVNAFFGLGSTQNNIKSVMMRILKENFKVPQNDVSLERDMKLYHDFNARRLAPQNDVSEYRFDKVVEFKNSAGEVVYRFGLHNYNTFGNSLSEQKDVIETLSKLDEEMTTTYQETMAKLAAVESNEEAMAILAGIQGKEITVYSTGKNGLEAAAEKSELAQFIIANYPTLNEIGSGSLTLKTLLTSFMALTK